MIKMRHAIITGTTIDARSTLCELPPLENDGSPVVWCPRTLGRDLTPTEIQRTMRLKRAVSVTSMPGKDTHCIPDRKIKLISKLPTWNSKLGSLVLGFKNKRVKSASSKNFLLVNSDSSNRVIFQFGKAKNVYNLDYRKPLSPLQAFGIGLSQFLFKVAVSCRK